MDNWRATWEIRLRVWRGKRRAAVPPRKIIYVAPPTARGWSTHVIKALSSVDQYYATHAAYTTVSPRFVSPSASFLLLTPPLPSDPGQIGSCISIATSRRKPFMDIFFPSVFSIIWFYFIFLFFLSYLLDIRYSSRVYKMMEIIVHVICYIGWEIVAFFLLVSIFESRFCLYILSHLYKDPRWYRVFQLKLTSITVDSTISSKKKKKQINVRPREFASKNLILRTPPAVKSKISELLL